MVGSVFGSSCYFRDSMPQWKHSTREEGHLALLLYTFRPDRFIGSKIDLQHNISSAFVITCHWVYVLVYVFSNSWFAIVFFSLMLRVIGISTVFTFVSVLISAEGANTTLMSILSIPASYLSCFWYWRARKVQCTLTKMDTAVYEDIILLGGIDMILLGTIFFYSLSMESINKSGGSLKWWKWLSESLWLYVIIGGLTVPLKPGCDKLMRKFCSIGRYHSFGYRLLQHTLRKTITWKHFLKPDPLSTV